jgi:hypothetical protein
MAAARAYNGDADGALKATLEGAGRKEYRFVQMVATSVEESARALLAFAYADSPRVTAARALLETVLRYAPRRGALSLYASPKLALRASEVAEVQGYARKAIARLILSWRDHDMQRWDLPKVTLRPTVIRVGAWGLGPEVVSERGAVDRPARLAAWKVADVLSDAMPWLRHCRVCGRLFYRVKAKAFCGPEHARVFFAREQRKVDREADRRAGRKAGKLRRGAKPIAYEETIIRQHRAWTAQAARREQLSRPRRRKARRQQ